jgi:hypothetical protein
MIALNSNPNVDNSDLINYPDGRIKDNDGSGNGTPVNRSVYGDLHSTISKLMRMYGIIPNGLPDNENNGYQIIEAMVGLASKNDFIYPLSTNGTVLSVDIKLSSMKTNEFIICLAGFNKSSEAQITGIGVGTFAITYSGNFKANEYVRVIKTASGVSIIRLSDAISLDAMVSELSYLKKASDAEELEGTIDTKATTPRSNALAFVERVNGASSGDSLATALRNGLYPKEHFNIVANLSASPVRNIGWFSGLDVGSSGGGVSLPVGGNITAAFRNLNSGLFWVVVDLENAMDNTDYYVRSFLKSESSNTGFDNNLFTPVFKPLTTLQFQLGFRESINITQNIKVYLEVVQF